MFSIKKVVSIFLVLAVVGVFIGSGFAAAPRKIVLDGRQLSVSTQPMLSRGEIYIPIASVVEAIGGSTSYNAAKKELSITAAGISALVTAKSKTATLNGKTFEMKNPAISSRGVILVPLSTLPTLLGAEAAYNKSMELVTIKYFTSMTGTLKVGGSTTVQPITQKAADILMARNKGLSVTISAPGSGAGINGAIDGTFHIGAASRELKSSELEKCPDLKQFQIGSDGIAIIINKANKVSNLTKQQVFDIFTGKITNWKDVGGTDSPIFVQTREVGSGTLDAFNELALHIIDKAAKIVSTATPNTSNGLVKEAVKGNKNAIGFISFGYLEGSVKGINIEGVSPTPANAMAKVWPYVRPLNVVTKGIPSALAAKFINYLKSDEGQNILVEEHYLPLKAND